MKIIQILLALYILIFTLPSLASSSKTPEELIAQSQQALVVTIQHWNDFQGQLLQFQRDPHTLHWVQVGEKIPVVVGNNGMGWGVELKDYHLIGPRKFEKDGRSPAGVYPIGPAFGYPAKPPIGIKLEYLPVSDTYFCNDHSNSPEYNQLLKNKLESIPSYWWNIELLRWGFYVQYNTPNPVPNAGSCVFMHIWESPKIGTQGCVETSVVDIEKLLKWLDPRHQPVIILMPKRQYGQLQKSWGMPPISWVQRLGS